MEYQLQTKTNQRDYPRKMPALDKPLFPNYILTSPFVQLQRNLGNQAFGRLAQAKLQLGKPGDIYEQEADRVAEQVMHMPASVSPQLVSGRFSVVKGKCAEEEDQLQCKPLATKITTLIQRQEVEEEEEEETVQSKEVAGMTSAILPSVENNLHHAANVAEFSAVPAIVHDVLCSTGKPLDSATRAFMESRFGHDFNEVRVHTDVKAEKSARALNSLAYTVGRNIVFAREQYRPTAASGRQLLAHELTHVVQQRAAPISSVIDRLTIDSSDSAAEREARSIGAEVLAGVAATSPVKTPIIASVPIISRADPQAVAVTINLGQTLGTGIQFWPTNVTDTRVGPVSVLGGLLSGQASRLNVIIGENLTLRTLARQLLPLWTTATPFTPPGAAAALPLDIIIEDELAQGLLVYNQYYLPVPAMTNWRSGLRFPLPVEIDETTGVATLHPLQIRGLASAFDPAWAPLLDLRASATAAPSAATLQADVTDFLARETTTLGRGIHLGARALTNARAELPFIQEVFRQLGSGAFDVALAFMDNLVNREIELLCAQQGGAAIIAEVYLALTPAPATLTADQQASFDRANLMLGGGMCFGAAAPPAATRSRPEKSVTIDTVKLDGSTHNPAADVAVANAIFAQCNVRLVLGIGATATAAETTNWLGGNTVLQTSPACGSSTVEEIRLFRRATNRFGLTARIRAFFPATISGLAAAGYAIPPFCATGTASPIRNMAVLGNTADIGDLAHEIGHILLNSGAHPAGTNLMNPFGPPQGQRLTDAQCTTIYNNA